MPAIDTNDVFITGHTLVSPFLFGQVAHTSLPNEVEHIASKDAIFLALLSPGLCVGQFDGMQRLYILKSLTVELGCITTIFLARSLLYAIGMTLRLAVKAL